MEGEILAYTVIAALRELEAELNATRPPLYADHPHPINLDVGMIRGGDWLPRRARRGAAGARRRA